MILIVFEFFLTTAEDAEGGGSFCLSGDGDKQKVWDQTAC